MYFLLLQNSTAVISIPKLSGIITCLDMSYLHGYNWNLNQINNKILYRIILLIRNWRVREVPEKFQHSSKILEIGLDPTLGWLHHLWYTSPNSEIVTYIINTVWTGWIVLEFGRGWSGPLLQTWVWVQCMLRWYMFVFDSRRIYCEELLMNKKQTYTPLIYLLSIAYSLKKVVHIKLS
jgi:hypothetical protein